MSKEEKEEAWSDLDSNIDSMIASRLEEIKRTSKQKFETGSLVQGYTGKTISGSSSKGPPDESKTSDGLGSLNIRTKPGFFDETLTFKESIDSIPKDSVASEAKTEPLDPVAKAEQFFLSLTPEQQARVFSSVAPTATTSQSNLETPIKGVSFAGPTSVNAKSSSSTVSPLTSATTHPSGSAAAAGVAVVPYGDAVASSICSGTSPRGGEDNSNFAADPNGTNPPPPICALCKQTGHPTAECPNWCKKFQALHKPCPTSKFKPVCNTCGGPHPMRDCPLCPHCGQHPKEEDCPVYCQWCRHMYARPKGLPSTSS